MLRFMLHQLKEWDIERPYCIEQNGSYSWFKHSLFQKRKRIGHSKNAIEALSYTHRVKYNHTAFTHEIMMMKVRLNSYSLYT